MGGSRRANSRSLPMRFPNRSFLALLVAAGGIVAATTAPAQGRGGALPDSLVARRWAAENELHALAVVERKVMI
jgi:hypothetical protein